MLFSSCDSHPCLCPDRTRGPSLACSGIHVQTERVAQTEADTLKLPGGDIQGTFLSLRDGTRDAGVRVKSAAAVTVAKLIGETKAIQDAESRR